MSHVVVLLIASANRASEHLQAIDAVYFNGSTADRTLLTIGTARRHNERVNGFCALRVSEFSDRVLVNPKFPDTNLVQTAAEASDPNAYAVQGIRVHPLQPMRSWKLTYSGQMRYADANADEPLLDVHIDAIWSSALPVFDFDTDISATTIARAIACEPWSRDYFQRLERFHQAHYEQHGNVMGTATIGGRAFALQVPAVRDHSYAEMRDWRNFHRYVMHFFSLANGDRVTVGVVSMPVTFSRLVVGFVTDAEAGRNYAVEEADLELYQHGEGGVPPRDYAFRFVAGECGSRRSFYSQMFTVHLRFAAGNRSYVVEVKSHTEFQFTIGESAESRVVEMYSEFVVNGVRGHGVAEWQYRNV